MKTVSLKIDDGIFEETEKIISEIKKTRGKYINDALKFYNRHQKRLLLEQILKKDLELTREESLNVLKEFEDIVYVN